MYVDSFWSIHGSTSQNTVNEIQTFWQPTDVFISEYWFIDYWMQMLTVCVMVQKIPIIAVCMYIYMIKFCVIVFSRTNCFVHNIHLRYTILSWCIHYSLVKNCSFQVHLSCIVDNMSCQLLGVCSIKHPLCKVSCIANKVTYWFTKHLIRAKYYCTCCSKSVNTHTTNGMYWLLLSFCVGSNGFTDRRPESMNRPGQ